jgi:hypothetical protein
LLFLLLLPIASLLFFGSSLVRERHQDAEESVHMSRLVQVAVRVSWIHCAILDHKRGAQPALRMLVCKFVLTARGGCWQRARVDDHNAQSLHGHRRRRNMRRLSPLVTLLLIVGIGRGVSAQTTYPVSSGDLDMRQVDLAFQGISPLNDSQYGWVGVNNSQILLNSTGGSLTLGYLNISTAQGWVVRNMPVDTTSGYTGIGTFFDLGESPGDVTGLQVKANISDAPLLAHGPVSGGDPVITLMPMTFDAQGAGGAGGGPSDPTSNPRTNNPAPTLRIDNSTLVFAIAPTSIAWQFGHPNIEQANNQCYPASVANSLKYLQTTTGVQTTAHNHVAGELDNSLVGQLDMTMNRPAGEYTPSALDMVHGKLDYLDNNNLENNVMTEHKQAPGIDWLDGNIQSTAGNATSTEDTTATDLIDWIIARVNQGKDVEIRIGWDGGGGHAVQLTGAGRIAGKPYITYAHDAVQADNTKGTGFFDGGHGFTFVDDNLGIKAFIGGETISGTISFAVAEMAVPPVPTPTATATPTPTPTATLPPPRHFECYEAPRERAAIFSVSLGDQFGPSTVSVIRRKRICNPSNKNGEDPSAPFDPNHLTGYVIKQTLPKFVRITGVTISNQFGAIIAELAKPDYMFVPAAKSLVAPPGPLVNPAVDHFKCYKLRRAKTRVSGITLTDQFGTLIFDARKPLRLCVAADKNGEGIRDPAANLLCYKGVQTSLPTFRGIEPVYIHDQFGAATTSVDHLRELCVPAKVNRNPLACPPAPEFGRDLNDPNVWNGDGAPNRQDHNNCYNYGTNMKQPLTEPAKGQPGRATGAEYTQHMCTDVEKAAKRDGLISIGNPAVGRPIPRCPGGTCPVALVVAPDPNGDYHWYRLNGDGSWSHKPGTDKATDKDSSGVVITDPRTADRRFTDVNDIPIGVAGVDGYKDFCGFMCVTATTSVRSVERSADARTQARVASSDVDARVLYYSGRPDPGWTFTSSPEIAEINCRLNAAVAAAPGGVSDPNWQGYLGTSGVRLISGSVTGLPEQLTVFRGTIEVNDSGMTTFYPDVAQLGEMLRCRAISEGYGAIVPSGSCVPLSPCP